MTNNPRYVPPTDPIWVDDELLPLDDAISVFFDNPHIPPWNFDLFPAVPKGKPELVGVFEFFEDDYLCAMTNQVDPLVIAACKAAEKAFKEVIDAGEIATYEADIKRRINWRDLPGADQYIEFQKERGCDDI